MDIPKSYIEKCIKWKDGIIDLFIRARCLSNGSQEKIKMPISGFEPGDLFNHLGSMAPDRVFKVDKVIVKTKIAVAGMMNLYPINECALVPTENQLVAALEACGWHLGEASGKGTESLLDEIINSGYFKAT